MRNWTYCLLCTTCVLAVGGGVIAWAVLVLWLRGCVAWRVAVGERPAARGWRLPCCAVLRLGGGREGYPRMSLSGRDGLIVSSNRHGGAPGG